jgi:hypothetical protein
MFRLKYPQKSDSYLRIKMSDDNDDVEGDPSPDFFALATLFLSRLTSSLIA